MAQLQITTLLSKIMQICRECPTPTMVAAYLDAAREFCSRSRWLLKNVPGVTVANTALYTLDLAATGDTFNEIIGIQAMSLTESASTIRALTETFSGGWDPNPLLTDTDIPEFYQYVPDGKVALYLTPNAIYPFLVNVAVQPKRDATSIEDTIITTWESALESGALAFLLNIPRTPWTDKAEAKAQSEKFDAACFSAAASAARGYNAGAQTTTRNGRTSGSLRTRVQVL